MCWLIFLIMKPHFVKYNWIAWHLQVKLKDCSLKWKYHLWFMNLIWTALESMYHQVTSQWKTQNPSWLLQICHWYLIFTTSSLCTLRFLIPFVYLCSCHDQIDDRFFGNDKFEDAFGTLEGLSSWNESNFDEIQVPGMRTFSLLNMWLPFIWRCYFSNRAV